MGFYVGFGGMWMFCLLVGGMLCCYTELTVMLKDGVEGQGLVGDILCRHFSLGCLILSF